jgi:adenylylsulfate kinase
MKILIMGLPGAGKSTLARSLASALERRGKTVTWLNADAVRMQFNDWDFSHEGRLRQATRMRDLADSSESDFVICDFVAPTQEGREAFCAEYTIWMDTIDSGRFENTNKIFTPPDKYDLRILEKKHIKWSLFIARQIQLAPKNLFRINN